MGGEVIQSHKPPRKEVKQDITVKRRGGGTLLDSRPVFSLDAKYVYLNCGWGIRVFSVKTGECVQCYSTQYKDESVASVFLYEGQPSAVTSNGRFYSWEAKSGKLLIAHNLEIPAEAAVTNGFLSPRLHSTDCFDICILIKKENTSNIVLRFADPKSGERIEHPLNNTIISNIDTQHNVSIGGPEDNKIIASISSEYLSIFTLNGKVKINGIVAGNNRKWTCVRVHPSDYQVAVGDNTGRVVLFRNPLKKGGKKPTTTYHWHTLPCKDIAFTPAGSSMYTGGGENVLVKWNLDNPQIRNYLPRLSAEITFIEISNNFEYVAVATLDNSIKVIDPQSKLVCVLQELAWGVLSVPGTPLFPAGLTFDPRTRALVLNGRPGHLQFYSPLNETLLFSIDVTLQNYLTQERDKVIYNTEVTGACISSNGAWMATIETRDDPSARLEERLKFWEYNLDKKSFTLNTSIEGPHNGKAAILKFRPGSKKLLVSDTDSLDYRLITTGSDDRFRIWAPYCTDSVEGKVISWCCDYACFYKQKQCGPFSFSEDGTIVGVGFDDVLVLYELAELKLTATLNTPTSRKPLKFVEFGLCDGFCEIVCATEDELFVWNLMTLSLIWKISLNTSILVQDSASSHFAVFTKTNEVLVFKTKSSEPVFRKDTVCTRKGEVLSAIFVPRLRHLPTVPSWMQDSQLFFINSNQELLCLESEFESTEASSLMITADIGPNTPFSSLLAAQTEIDKTKSKTLKQNTGYGVIGASAVSQLLKYPAHTMPNVSLLCGSFVQSLVQKKIAKEDLAMEVCVSDDEGVEEDNSSSSESSSDEESISGKKRKPQKSPMLSSKVPKSPSMKESDSSDPTRAEKLSLFFKDLDDNSDKTIDIFGSSTSKNDKFVFDGIS